jgi:hypothetical protein
VWYAQMLVQYEWVLVWHARVLVQQWVLVQYA